ncbi:MAG: molybdopterin-guanine dinucleotide biosynthesis protein MobB, partial [Pseudomonadota bacterium]
MTIKRPANEAPRIGIVGWKNSGKTTLAAALINTLTERGLLVSSVKSAAASVVLPEFFQPTIPMR